MTIEVKKLDEEAILILNGYEMRGWYPEVSAPNYIDKGVIVIPNDENEYSIMSFWDMIKEIRKEELPVEIQFDISPAYSENPPLDKVSYPFTSIQFGKKNKKLFTRFSAITERRYSDEWNKKWAINFYFNAFKKFEEIPNIKVTKSDDEDDYWTLDVELLTNKANTIYESFEYSVNILTDLFRKVELSLSGLDNFLNVVEIWNKNQNEKDEKFWQKLIKENAWLISLAFNQPLFIFKDEGYLGGKSIGNIKGKVVDFVYRNKLTNNIALIEIKTPLSKMVGGKYRDSHSLSRELTGSMNQILRYKDVLTKEFYVLKGNSNEDFEFFNTKGIVIIGKVNDLDQSQRRTFELYRNELRNIDIIGFDELVEKVFMVLNLIEMKK